MTQVNWMNYTESRVLKIKHDKSGVEFFAYYDNDTVYWDIFDIAANWVWISDSNHVISKEYSVIEDYGDPKKSAKANHILIYKKLYCYQRLGVVEFYKKIGESI